MDKKQDKNPSVRRRTFLAQAGILAGLTINSGVAAADSGGKEIESATDSGRVTPVSPTVEDKEFEKYVRELREKYGLEPTKSLQKRTTSEDDLSTQNLTGDPDIEGRLINRTTGRTETDHAEADHIIEVYETDTYRLGRRKYVYWHWSAARPFDGWGYYLRDFHNAISHNGDYRLARYSPTETYDTSSGIPITLGIFAGGDGIGAEAGTRFQLFEDTYGPKPGRTNLSNGEFAVRWTGRYGDAQSIEGFSVDGRDGFPTYDYDYHFNLEASRI
jgi:hypothetical protein